MLEDEGGGWRWTTGSTGELADEGVLNCVYGVGHPNLKLVNFIVNCEQLYCKISELYCKYIVNINFLYT